MYAGSYLGLTALQDFALRVPLEWLVRILVLTSMTLQLVLVVLAARRYLSSRGILRFMVWGAYISADAVAISALGTMMHSARREMYGIWAPLLLMHLGGPDAITAYSMADNELWLRHGFNMVYQVSMAVYVIYASSLKVYPLAAAILLLLVGSIKYAEWTLALRYGNYLRNVLSSLPISKYMDIKSVAEKWKYVVMGEDQVERMIEEEQASSLPKGLKGSSTKGGEIVTIKDVERASISGRGYDLCVSHALFKMYKQRFGSSYFVEGDLKETRAFWGKFSGGEAFRIVEMELKFMYDAIFSKYSNPWFTKWGMLLRFLNIVLLGAAGYLILGERESREAQGMVTYVVISVAFVVEVIQIWRVVVSDWTRVHLICAYVVASRRPESHISEWCRLKAIKITMAVLGSFQDFVGRNRYLGNVVGEKRYWSNQISQHCLIDTWLNRSPIMCKVAGLFPKPDSSIVSWYINLRRTHNEHIEDDHLKGFIFEIIKEVCAEKYSAEECKQNVYNFEKNLFQGEPGIREILESHGNLEEVILMWHIATTICDRQRGFPQKNETVKNFKLSRILSRYCAYLLLSRPNLLPIRPKVARIVYMQVVNQLLETVTLGSFLEKNLGDLLGCNENLLGFGVKLAKQLLKKEEGEMWKLLAEYWGKLVIYMALYNKAIYHVECMAGGGEFLSQVWVLLGHMGCGEQSDSAVTKKFEVPSDKEVAVAERSTGQDPATVENTQSDLQNESEATKNISSVSEIELASTN